MADLSPDELDALEDALDSITGSERVDDVRHLELPDAIATQAAAYVELLDVVDEHLPSVEPSDGVLDTVFSAARSEMAATATVDGPVRAIEEAPDRSRGGWRRWFVPTLSLAGYVPRC